MLKSRNSSFELPILSKLKVRNKILVGFVIILAIFLIGMFVNFTASQNLSHVNRVIVDKYSAIDSQSYELSLAYDSQQSLYQSYAAGNVTGSKSLFIQNENALDQNVSQLENNTVGTSGKTIVNSIKAERLQFYGTVVNGVMTLPTQDELNSLDITGQTMLRDALDMYTSMIQYQLTGNTSKDNSYKTYKSEFLNNEGDFQSNLSEIQNINTSVYDVIYNDFGAIKTYFTAWTNNVMDPASTSLSSNGTAWVISNIDSILPIEGAINRIDVNISTYDKLASTALFNADSAIHPIQQDLASLRVFAKSEMAKGKVQAQNSVNMVTSTTLLVALGGIVASVIIGLSISSSIANPLSDLSISSKKISSGDLTIDIHSSRQDRSDEIGELASHFNMMVTYLKETVTEISNVASSLSAAAQEMASSAEEVNSSSEEISAISQQMAKGSIDQSNQINEAVKIASELRVDFEQKISNINSTSSLIESIASQVNMLALNASIEAARAGEYGRGFSVVADNIRKLADDSKNSVGSVQSVIESLKASLSSSIDDLTNSIEKIASVAEETSSGAEESSAATEEQAATMEEMAASAQELAVIASNLEGIIKKFNLETV